MQTIVVPDIAITVYGRSMRMFESTRTADPVGDCDSDAARPAGRGSYVHRLASPMYPGGPYSPAVCRHNHQVVPSPGPPRHSPFEQGPVLPSPVPDVDTHTGVLLAAALLGGPPLTLPIQITRPQERLTPRRSRHRPALGPPSASLPSAAPRPGRRHGAWASIGVAPVGCPIASTGAVTGAGRLR